MFWTPRLQNALAFATKAHEGQLRKSGDKIPYIVHPVSVAMLLTRYLHEEDVIIAGLLHDTVEDTEVTLKQISKEFGSRVSEIVEVETETQKELPWETRKAIALGKLEDASEEACAVKAADAISNLRDFIEGEKKQKQDFWVHFKRGRMEQTARFAALVSLLCTRDYEFDTGIAGLSSRRQEIFDELRDTFDEFAKGI
jgi:(p)ppGpp synthase/HD superfamily hydrolase